MKSRLNKDSLTNQHLRKEDPKLETCQKSRISEHHQKPQFLRADHSIDSVSPMSILNFTRKIYKQSVSY